MHSLFGDFLLHLLFIVCQCVHVDVLLHVVKLETVVVPYGERMRTFHTKGYSAIPRIKDYSPGHEQLELVPEDLPNLVDV